MHFLIFALFHIVLCVRQVTSDFIVLNSVYFILQFYLFILLHLFFSCNVTLNIIRIYVAAHINTMITFLQQTKLGGQMQFWHNKKKLHTQESYRRMLFNDTSSPITELIYVTTRRPLRPVTGRKFVTTRYLWCRSTCFFATALQ